MYKIPVDFNTNKLRGSNLSQICYSSNSISLSFGLIGLINIWGEIYVSVGTTLIYHKELFPLSNDLGLLIFLENTLTDITVNENREVLKLFFGDLGFIELRGNVFFESYQISIGTDEIII